MSRKLKWGLTLLALFCICLIARLPALFVMRATLPAAVSLAGVEGSVWSGSASVLGFNGVVIQEKLRWKFQPRNLLHGNLAWQIDSEFRGAPATLHASLGLHGGSLEGIRLSLPLDPLMHFNSMIEGVKLSGTVRLEADRLAMHEPIRLKLRAEQVTTAMGAEPSLLGSYEGNLDVDASGKGQLQVTSLGGPLQITGGGSFETSGKAVDMKLLLRPAGDLPVLAPILATLPHEGDQAVVKIKRS
jgi:general secretion pathway protein N